ncbi:right-handed parallel beta-helix repeat-containing protein [Treponema porcinum]|uniref:right-handed parallel beta-helix repeat-containing protein n=2 Tax=Treponema porcinum TaxID=261392 RepID=UPI002353D8DF|nr:right-handed parallel beta-helix repeat-containing protein [Treponema porcinum]MCI6480952.1 right-handed parallel beta-helix repeat-containing protein [Treponema porcinum]
MKKDRKIKNKIFSKLLTLTGILFAASLFLTGCADFAGSSDSKKETFTITVKTQNITSKTETKNRSAFPALSGSENYTLSYKSGESTVWKSLDGTFPEYQMIIIPGTYTLKLDVYSDAVKTNHILTGNNSLTVTSGMENAEVSFILQPPENSTGNGSVSLVLSAETDTQITTFEIKSDLTLTWTKNDTETSYTKGTITADSVTAGTYHLTIYGKTTTDETVYVRSETLTVWEGLESSVWIFADGTSSNELKITASDLYSTFYVKGSTGPYNFYKEGVFGDANASDDNSGSIDCPLQTVSVAVNKCVVSNKPYTIYVDGTVKEAIDSTSTDPSAIEIYKKIITIKSIKPEVGKAVIQADGNGRIMYAGGTVVLEDLVLKGGDNTNFGGGIYVSSSWSLTMKNCTITDCNATTSGGGLYIATNGSANISGCTISGNKATDETNGIGGGIMANGTLIADGTSISNNNSGKDGGGICIASDVTATLTGCTISENSANSTGGGLKIYSPAKLTNCKILENSSGWDGGGFGCEVSASDSATINVIFTECEIIENTSGNNGGGGAILSNVNATFKSCKIDGNTTKFNGGGLLLYGTPTATLEDCTISGNTANNPNGNGGGGIRTDSTGPTLKLTGTTSISGNITPSGGVGKSMYLNSGYMHISGAIHIDDDVSIRTDGSEIRTTITGSLTGTTPVITITPTEYTAGKQIVSAGSGVTLSDEAGKFKISNPDYIISKEGKLCYLGTTSTSAEDNIAIFTNIPAGCEATVNLDNLSQTSWSGFSPAEISGNVTVTATNEKTISSASDSIFTVKNGGTLTLNEKVTLEPSSSGKSCINVEEGGTLILNGATIQATSGFNVSGITITHGTLTINTGNITNFTGSPIVATNSIITITGGTISSNFSNVKLTDCTANIKNLIVTGNTTSGNGGGINISGGGTYMFNDCQITNNTASVRGGTPRYGGGIYIDTTGTVSFTNCNISGNTANGYGSSSGKGGGIYLKSGTLTTTGCTINNNTTKNSSTITTDNGSQIYAVAGSVYNGETLTEGKIIDE